MKPSWDLNGAIIRVENAEIFLFPSFASSRTQDLQTKRASKTYCILSACMRAYTTSLSIGLTAGAGCADLGAGEFGLDGVDTRSKSTIFLHRRCVLE